MSFLSARPRSLLPALALLIVAACDSGTPSNAAAPAAKGAKENPAPAPGGDWAATVVETPEGGFRMGNPNAPVKLVGYLSLWCPHCAQFTESAFKPLKNNYISTGKVSYELRPFVLNSPDIAVTMATACQGPKTFFQTANAVFTEQPVWQKKLVEQPQAEMQRVSALPQAQQFGALLTMAGLDSFFALRGVPKSRLAQCLSDKARLDKIGATLEGGVKKYDITGTPTFILNGEKQEGVFDWGQLEPKLRAALG